MCNKAEYLYNGEKLVLQYYDDIAHLFDRWQIPAPVMLQTLSDAVTLGGQDFKEDLYAATVGSCEQDGRMAGFAGDPAEKLQFMDFIDVLNDILGSEGTAAPQTESPDPKKPNPPKSNTIMGMESSNFYLLIALVILVILIVIVAIR